MKHKRKIIRNKPRWCGICGGHHPGLCKRIVVEKGRAVVQEKKK